MANPPPPAPRLVYYPTTAAHLNAAELQAVFAKIGRHDVLWQALMQLLQERLANATVDAANSEPTAAGRLQEILGLQQQLFALRQPDPLRQRPGKSG